MCDTEASLDTRAAALQQWYNNVDGLVQDAARFADQFTLDRFASTRGQLTFRIVVMALAILLPLSIKFARPF